jgi:hypothetical protein
MKETFRRVNPPLVVIGSDSIGTCKSHYHSVSDLGQMIPLTWTLKEVDPVGLNRQSGIHAQEI